MEPLKGTGWAVWESANIVAGATRAAVRIVVTRYVPKRDVVMVRMFGSFLSGLNILSGAVCLSAVPAAIDGLWKEAGIPERRWDLCQSRRSMRSGSGGLTYRFGEIEVDVAAY